jgi:hypothetical protein
MSTQVLLISAITSSIFMTDHMLHIQQSQASFNGSRDAESAALSVSRVSSGRSCRHRRCGRHIRSLCRLGERP